MAGVSIEASRVYTCTTSIPLQEKMTAMRVPLAGTESHAAYMRMTKAQQDGLKDIGGFVGGFILFKPWFNLPPIGKGDMAILIVFALLAKPVMDLWSKGLDVFRHKIEKFRGEWDI